MITLQDQLDDVIELCKENPRFLKTADVARILGMNPEGLRCAIDAGKCPFGLSWQKNIHGNRGYKIPTVTFLLWYTAGQGLGAEV